MNWFAFSAQNNFAQHLAPLMGHDNLKALQIGVFTGDASDWLLYFVLSGEGSTLDDVDTWSGSAEHDDIDFSLVEAVYDERFSELEEGRLRKHKMTSDEFFAECSEIYDFIYIDGDHTAAQVAVDAKNAHEHLKVGGFLAFDDYEWNPGDFDEMQTPRPAIDAFLESPYMEHYELLGKNLQVWLRRVS